MCHPVVLSNQAIKVVRFSATPTGQKDAAEMLEGLIARSERKLNETILSARAAELSDEARENLKREIVEEVAKNLTKAKEEDMFASDISMENATDFAKQITELRTNVLTNTQRE